MGGYGALWLGGQLGAPTVAAVVAESPALWHHADDTASGAFDDHTTAPNTPSSVGSTR
jgi:hypothetical protein